LNCVFQFDSDSETKLSQNPFVLILSYIEESKHAAATFVMHIASLGIVRLCPSTGSGRTDLSRQNFKLILAASIDKKS